MCADRAGESLASCFVDQSASGAEAVEAGVEVLSVPADDRACDQCEGGGLRDERGAKIGRVDPATK